MDVGVWVVVVGGGVVVVVVGGGVVVVVVVGGWLVVVVGREVVVVVVVGRGVVALEVVVIVVVGGLLDVVVDAVVFWHPMIDVIKTKLTTTRRKPKYLLFINAFPLYIFKFRFSNILLKNGHASVGFSRPLQNCYPSLPPHEKE